MPTNRYTALAAGFWSALPLDYFLRIAGMRHLRTRPARTLPFGSLDHPLAPALLLRTMRLNCLTNATPTCGRTSTTSLARRGLGLLLGMPAPLGDVRPNLGARHPAAHRAGSPLGSRRDRCPCRRLAWHGRGALMPSTGGVPGPGRLRGRHLVRRQRPEARGLSPHLRPDQRRTLGAVPGLPGGPGEQPAPGRLHASVLQGRPDRRVPAGARGLQRPVARRVRFR